MEYLIALFFVGSMVDTYLTVQGDKAGIFAEANPLFKGLLRQKMYVHIYILKTIVTLLVVWLMLATMKLPVGKVLVIFGVISQAFILYRQWKYRKIYYAELNNTKGDNNA